MDKMHRMDLAKRYHGTSCKLAPAGGYNYFWNKEIDSEKNFDDRMQAGLIAQELFEVIPEAVFKDDALYVNYNFVIPYIIEAIKEQQAQIVELKNQLMTTSSVRIGEINSGKKEVEERRTKNRLEQNIPNPFSGSTTIRYSFVEGNRASLMFFDLNGTAVHQVENLETGDHELVLELSKLASGMYYYSLVVDGAESVTKRMILNK